MASPYGLHRIIKQFKEQGYVATDQGLICGHEAGLLKRSLQDPNKIGRQPDRGPLLKVQTS
jgi:hypothetical protein